MANTGQQQPPLDAGIGIMVQERRGGAASQQRGVGNRRFGRGSSQERDPSGTPPLAVKPPRPETFGDRTMAMAADPDKLKSCSGGGGTDSLLASHDSDLELERLWDRFNSLKGEIPATSNTPPPGAEHSSSSSRGGVASESRTRRAGAAAAGGGGATGDEAWAHRREIAGKLEDIQRALAAKAEDGRRRHDELEGLYRTIGELEAYVELEASKRLEAECRAQNLEAGLQVLADRCDLEIAARETAESAAKRYMDLIAEARAAWQKTQDIVQNKERELAAAERRVEREAAAAGGDVAGAGAGSLQRRLEDARKDKEKDRQHSASLKLALEGGVPSPGSAPAADTAAAAAVPTPKSGRRRSVGSLVDIRGGNAERRGAPGTIEATSPVAASQRLSLDPGRVAAAEARLQVAIDEAAAAAAATPNTTTGASPRERQRKARPEPGHAPRRRRQRQPPPPQQQQQRQQRGDSDKPAPRPRVVPSTKDRPELGGGDIYRRLGGAYTVATTSSINDSGGAGAPCTYSGTALNHDRYYPKEACYVNDYFSVDEEHSGVDEGYSESRAYKEGGREKEAGGRLGVCRETMVKLKGTVGSAVVKAMNDGGKNMKVHDSKRGTELIAALCSISSGFAF